MVHEHSEDCCCGDEDGGIVSIEYEDGTAVDCEILGTFEANGKNYIALVPQKSDENDDEDDNVLIYRYEESDEDNFELIDIEDEEEFNKAAEVLDGLLNDETE